MFTKQFFLLFFACFFIASFSNAQNNNSEKAKAILAAGKKNLKRMSYKYSITRGTGKHIRTTSTYHKANPDGTTYYRYESIRTGASSSSYLYIRNNAGAFQIIGDIAVKCSPKLFLPEKGVIEAGANATYSLKNGTHLDIPCYVVSKKVKPTEKNYRNFMKPEIKEGKKTPAQLKKFYKESFPVLQIYYIGKKNGFIYQSSSYNVNGKKTGSLNRGIVELNASLDDKLFQIPENYTIRIANNSKEFIKLYTKAIRENKRKKRKKKK